MKRVALAAVAVALVVGSPAASGAKPPSFAIWWSNFTARVQRDVVRVTHACQKSYGTNDAKIGACFVKRERISLRQERVAWESQLERIARGQKVRCRRAIGTFRAATRTSAMANLRYLDTHRHSALSEISREAFGGPPPEYGSGPAAFDDLR